MSDFVLTAGINFSEAEGQVDAFVKNTEQKMKRASDIISKAQSSDGSLFKVKQASAKEVLDSMYMGDSILQAVKSQQDALSRIHENGLRNRQAKEKSYSDLWNGLIESGEKARVKMVQDAQAGTTRIMDSETKQRYSIATGMHAKTIKLVESSVKEEFSFRKGAALGIAKIEDDAAKERYSLAQNGNRLLASLEKQQQREYSAQVNEAYQIDKEYSSKKAKVLSEAHDLNKQFDASQKASQKAMYEDAYAMNVQISNQRKASNAAEIADLKAINTATNRATGMNLRIDRQITDPAMKQDLTSSVDKALKAYTDTVGKFGSKSLEAAKAHGELQLAFTRINGDISRTGGLLAVLNRGFQGLTIAGQDVARFITNTSVAFQALMAVMGLRQIIDANVNLEKFGNTLKSVSGSPTEFATNMVFLRNTADNAGVSIEAVGDPFARFAIAAKGAGFSAEETRTAFYNLTVASRNFGLSAAETQGVVKALEQSLSKGKFMAEEVRGQLGDRLPVAMKAMAVATGKSSAELTHMLETGQLTVQKYFIPYTQALASLSGGQEALNRSSKSLQAELDRLSNSFLYAMQSVGQNGFTSGITKAAKALNDFMSGDTGESLAKGLGGVVDLLATGFAGLLGNIEAVSAGLLAFFAITQGAAAASAAIRGLSAAVSTLFGPIGIAAGIAVAVAGFVSFRKEAKEANTLAQAYGISSSTMARAVKTSDEATTNAVESQKNLNGELAKAKQLTSEAASASISRTAAIQDEIDKIKQKYQAQIAANTAIKSTQLNKSNSAITTISDINSPDFGAYEKAKAAAYEARVQLSLLQEAEGQYVDGRSRYFENLSKGTIEATNSMAELAKGFKLVDLNGTLVTDKEKKLAEFQQNYNYLLANGSQEAPKFGRALQAMKDSLDPVTSAMKEANDQIARFKVPEGVQRDALAIMQQKYNADPSKDPNSPESLKEKADLITLLKQKQDAAVQSDINQKNITFEIDKKIAKAQGAGDQANVIRLQRQREAAILEAKGTDAKVAGESATQAQTLALSQYNAQLGHQGVLLIAAAKGQLAVAQVADRGEAAMRQVEYENKLIQAQLEHRNVEAQRQANLIDEQTVRTKIAKEFEGNINLEIAGNERLAKATLLGADAVRQAETYTAAFAQTLREVPYDPTKGATEEFTKALNKNVDTINRQKDALDSVDLSNYVTKLKDASKELDFRANSAGMSEGAKNVAKAEFDALEYSRKRWGEYDKLNEKQKQATDELVKQAKLTAEQENSVKRTEDAWTTVTDSISNAASKVGDALVEAFTKGETKAINWGSITKGIIASLMSDLVKMSLINPLSNAVLGTNKGTVFDLLGSVQGAQNGGVSSLLSGNNSLSLGSLSSKLSGGWLDRQLGGSLTSASGWLSTPVYGGSITASNGMIAGGESITSSGQTLAGSGGVNMGDMLGGGMYGIGAITNFASGNVAGGIGNTAAAIMSFIPGLQPFAPIAAIAGQLLGGLFGKNRGDPAAAASSVWKDGQINGGWANTDNNGSQEQANQLQQSISSALTTFFQNSGATATGPVDMAIEAKKGTYRAYDGSGQLGTSFSTLDEAVIHDFKDKISRGLISVSEDVTTAMQHSTTSDINKFMSDVGFAKNFRSTLDQLNASLDPTNNQLKALEDNAKKTGEAIQTSIVDWKTSAVSLGLATEAELVPSLVKGVKAMLGLGQTSNPLIGLAAVTRQAELNFTAAKPALQALGLAEQELSDIRTQVTQKAIDDYNKAYDLYKRNGEITINQAIDPNYYATAPDIMKNLNLDPSKFIMLTKQLDELIANAQTGAVTVESLKAAWETLNKEFYDGKITTEQYTSITQTLADTYTKSTTTATALTKAQSDAADAVLKMQQDIYSQRISYLSDEISAVDSSKTAMKGFVDSVATLRQNLITSKDLGILSPEKRLAQSITDFKTAMLGTTSSDPETRSKAYNDIQTLAQTVLQNGRDYYQQSSDYEELFRMVDGELNQAGKTAAQQVSAQQAQLDELKSQTNTLQAILSTLQSSGKSASWDTQMQMVQKVMSSPSYNVGVDALGRSLSELQPGTSFTRGQWQAIGRVGGYTGNYGAGGHSAFLQDPTNLDLWNKLIGYAASLPKFADGGYVTNGKWGVDSVHAMLAGGEFIMPAAQTTQYLPQLEAMRSGTASSGGDSQEVVTELKALVRLQSAANQALIAKMTDMEARLAGIEQTARLEASK